MKKFAGWCVAVLCLGGGLVVGQDNHGSSMMMKNAMTAKKTMMEPKAMKAAAASMMGETSMMPVLLAKEMMHHEMMHDREVMDMVDRATMTKSTNAMTMPSERQVQAAMDKMVAETETMQLLFQELVARHIAGMRQKARPEHAMMAMADKDMKTRLVDEESMMAVKNAMMNGEESAMVMAREWLIRSLMQDEEVMAVVKRESMMHEAPDMAPMISEDKVKMAGDKMMRDKESVSRMLHETMARRMIDGKKPLSKKDDGRMK